MLRIIRFKNYLMSISILGLGLIGGNAIASDVYDAATNRLYIPSVQVGNDTFVDVVVTIDELISVGGLSDNATQTYNMQSMYEALVKSSASYQFSLKGSVSGTNITGSGSMTSGNLTSSSFQGFPALTKTSNVIFSLNVNGQVVPSAASGQLYYDSNYNFLGQSGSEFEVVTSRNPFPTAAKLNDAGVLYTSTVYTSSAKSSIIGTQTASYSITYDSESSIILTIINIRKNLAGSVIQTNTSLFRVTSNNVVTRLLETVVLPTKSRHSN